MVADRNGKLRAFLTCLVSVVIRCHALHEETPTPALPTTTLATLVVTLTVVVAVAHHTV